LNKPKPRYLAMLAIIVGLTLSFGIVSKSNQGQAQSVDGVFDSTALVCSKCKGAMETGVMQDYYQPDSAQPEVWASFAQGKLPFARRPKEIKIRANRCTNCGYVELYAK
jgi:hypothetical protein